MKLETYLRETKEKFVLIEDKNRIMIANGKPKDLFMLSAYMLKNEILEIVQEIDDFPYSIIIDCEVFTNVSKR